MDYTLTPAYGRDYKSKGAVLLHWFAGKDFRIGTDGPYTSIRDVKMFPGDTVSFRYNKLTEKFTLTKHEALNEHVPK